MEQLETKVTDDPRASEFIYGSGPAILALNSMVAEIAPTDIPVLLIGESGTGKDAYARLIHRLSPRGSSQFRTINCSSIVTEELQKSLSDLFVACTAGSGAVTLYLDNIQDLNLDCQRTLLSRLPDEENSMLEGRTSIRLISSATQELEFDLEAGRFRRELYFRLNAACLRIPPLRERQEDLPLLLDHFLRKHSNLLRKKTPPIGTKASQSLVAYRWPGNIRELENVARKIVVFGDAQMTLNDLQAARMVGQKPGESVASSSLKVAARAASKLAERELIIQALERTRWNRKRAAHDLQISYKSLLHKIKQIGPLNGDRQG
jgi:two-component system, NtrC family, response regulator AtoC